ncbi:polyprenyl synthetase family protein [Streptacidiphilus sp. P02-A3a]|uniref:polyprenyl synthetase family protein n=1 Tax=Streptacidiphilus sp. P02-A3a TaxID=2704468 RepID=UPI0015FDEB2E|nr:polyprenyl synthetase family protein [Streptacidiphilus sp. P02-A3a]QMU69778.1 polyprenyl synthetase family protein [Streptacidiphilus sp. P02-A3a]
MITENTLLADLGSDSLAHRLQSGLAEAEELLLETVESDDFLLTETSRHLAFAGGKRFRPTLVLLAAQFGDPNAERVVPSAVLCELTHLASLYHDDVMDKARARRNVVSANARWGNAVAVLTGDYLFLQAARIGTSMGTLIGEVYTTAVRRLVVGQFRETVGAFPGQDPLKHYLDVVADKTGSLIAACCRLGALVAGAEEGAVAALTAYGEQTGIAFQLADDLIDVGAGAESSGKAPGTDLREGVASLPVLHARARAGHRDARLIELLDSDLAADPAALQEALVLLRAHPAMDDARRDLELYVERAVRALDPLPDGPAKDALRRLAEGMLTRDR